MNAHSQIKAVHSFTDYHTPQRQSRAEGDAMAFGSLNLNYLNFSCTTQLQVTDLACYLLL